MKYVMNAKTDTWRKAGSSCLEDYETIFMVLLGNQPHKMIKHTQKIRWQQPTNFLSEYDHFVGLAFNGLKARRKAT